jgi:hypothetical protein
MDDSPSFDARLSRLRLSALGFSFFKRCSSLIFSRRWTSAEISSVPSDVDVNCPSCSVRGWGQESRYRLGARFSSVGSGRALSLSREILRLFLRVLASVSVDCVGLEELDELEVEGVAFPRAVMSIPVCIAW